MRDLKNEAKQLQIFYTFVVNYETLSKTIRQMALGGNMEEYIRAEALCDVVGTYLYGKDNLDDVKIAIASYEYPEALMPLLEDLMDALSGQQDSLMMQLNARYQMLLDILLLKDTIRPTETRKKRQEDVVDEEEENVMIKEDPGHAIEGEDLAVLNEIASAVVADGVLLSDYSKRFKTPEVRDRIKRIYHENPYYFEQSFSNTSVNIQYIILEIIEEDLRRNIKDEKKMEALQSLRDLHILSTIDTSANKMTSKVSDHQAFELFLNVLAKNNNEYIIRKLVGDDVIMHTLFDISTKDKESHYGFRRMFTTARFPFDGIIVDRFRELKKIDSKAFQNIVRDLSRYKNFLEAYENYQKTERTHAFLQVMKDTRSHLFKDVLTQEMVYGLCYLLEEFAKLEDYNHDLLTVDKIMVLVEEMYWYIIRKGVYGKYPLMEGALNQFFKYRIDNALNSSKHEYKAFGGETTYGITSQDLWFDLHCLLNKYGFDEVKKIYLRYGVDDVKVFEVGHRLKEHEGTFGSSDVKGLGRDECSFMCANNDMKGFEQYVFNLYGRFMKAFMADYIDTKLMSIKTSAFRKVEIPGLSVKDDQRIRKAILDYMTLQFLWYKDCETFLHVYKTRVSGVMKALGTMEKTSAQMKPFVSLGKNHWILEMFNHKSGVNRMLEAFNKLTASAKDKHYTDHARGFFELAKPE